MRLARVVTTGVLAVGLVGQFGVISASADTLRSCRSRQAFSSNTVVYTGTCPDGFIGATSRNFYAGRPKITGDSFGKRFEVRMRRGERVSISGRYGKAPVSGVRDKEWLPNGRFALTATGRFGGASVRCYTTGTLRGPGVDQTRWYGLTVNGTSDIPATSRAWKRCAFLLLVSEAFAYTEV